MAKNVTEISAFLYSIQSKTSFLLSRLVGLGGEGVELAGGGRGVVGEEELATPLRKICTDNCGGRNIKVRYYSRLMS